MSSMGIEFWSLMPFIELPFSYHWSLVKWQFSEQRSDPLWLVAWNIWIIFPYILGIIIPTDFHSFQRAGEKPPTSYNLPRSSEWLRYCLNYKIQVLTPTWCNNIPLSHYVHLYPLYLYPPTITFVPLFEAAAGGSSWSGIWILASWRLIWGGISGDHL